MKLLIIAICIIILVKTTKALYFTCMVEVLSPGLHFITNNTPGRSASKQSVPYYLLITDQPQNTLFLLDQTTVGRSITSLCRISWSRNTNWIMLFCLVILLVEIWFWGFVIGPSFTNSPYPRLQFSVIQPCKPRITIVIPEVYPDHLMMNCYRIPC